jgi:hypothetical protein
MIPPPVASPMPIVVVDHAVHRDVFELPVEKLAVEGLGFVDVGGGELRMDECVCHV